MDSATPYNGISFVLLLAVVYINTKKGDYRNALDQFKVCIYNRARQPLPRMVPTQRSTAVQTTL